MARKGTFKVTGLFLMTHASILEKELLAMKILRRDMSLISNEITYTAICDAFDDIPDGCIVPEYHILSDGYEITFERVG